MKNIFKKENIVSFAQTFVSTFIVCIGVALTTLPDGTLFNVDFYKSGALASLLIGSARSAIKVAWQKTLPVKLGGVRKV